MFTLQKSYVDGELWYAVFEDGVFFCAWHNRDLPIKYKFLLEN